ncbi:MAG: S-methyl-5-thioribose-1-phosphate isomerase [Candidatus Glassbacteria bacterium]|nr:S-methyl-5-thioribose-1-phosphate isomerase [Candidatus Glassbacteria bacterium]
MVVETITWLGNAPGGRVKLIDQTLLPGEEVYLERSDYRDIADDIRRLAVRGAPAIGVAGALAVVLGMQGGTALAPAAFRARLAEVRDELAGTRPTAVNLFWAIDRVKRVADNLDRKTPSAEILSALEREAVGIMRQDRELCRAIGEHGAPLVADSSRVLTHCNAGALATAGIGTALAVIYVATEQGRHPSVWVDETRPLLQGARLTAWELTRAGVPATLICDNMSASLMAAGKVDMVITGADRIAANGDTANKIGTYGVACLAERHDVPFYVAAPFSTFDLEIPDGSRIPIEQRDPAEVTAPRGVQFAPEGMDVFNPAFDVTPAELIAGIITDKGVLRPPYTESIRHALAG